MGQGAAALFGMSNPRDGNRSAGVKAASAPEPGADEKMMVVRPSRRRPSGPCGGLFASAASPIWAGTWEEWGRHGWPGDRGAMFMDQFDLIDADKTARSPQPTCAHRQALFAAADTDADGS